MPQTPNAPPPKVKKRSPEPTEDTENLDDEPPTKRRNIGDLIFVNFYLSPELMFFSRAKSTCTMDNFLQAYEETNPQYLMLCGPTASDLRIPRRREAHSKYVDTVFTLQRMRDRKIVLVDTHNGPTWH